MENLRRFPAPWSMEERKDGFEVKEASGFFICGIPHREDNGYLYAHQFLSREEARRIAKVISRLPSC